MRLKAILKNCFQFLFLKIKIMKTKKVHPKYVEWFSAEVMHENSNEWLSDLKFINDELLFFDDLVKTYTLQLIDSKHFNESKIIIDKLDALHKKNNSLIRIIQKHINNLKIMVDGVIQPDEEDIYKNEHRELIIKVNEFIKKCRKTKKDLFDLIKNILKEQKQKLLLQ